MNPLRDRYVDRDVRDDANLVDVAESYVQRYTGDFSFLLDCRERLVVGGGLTVSQVRGVLNCMRSDPRVGHLPAPRREPMVGAKIIQLPTRVTHKQRPFPYMNLQVRWKHEFGISTHKQARVVHRVRRDSGIRYYLHATESPFHERFKSRLRWVCVPGHRNTEVELLSAHDVELLIESHTNWKRCGTCARSPHLWLRLDEH